MKIFIFCLWGLVGVCNFIDWKNPKAEVWKMQWLFAWAILMLQLLDKLMVG